MLPAQIWRDFVAYAVSARKLGAGPVATSTDYSDGVEGLRPGWEDGVQGEIIEGQPAPMEGEPLPPPPMEAPPFAPPPRGDWREERPPPRYDPRDEPPPEYEPPPPRFAPPPPRYEEPPYGEDELIDEGDGFGPGAG
jgi:hypothetical protein